MKIMLINPPLLSSPGLANTTEIYPPTGLAYIAAVLEQQGHEVNILDAIVEDYHLKKYDSKYILGMDYDTIAKIVLEKKPMVIGITVPFTAHAPSAMETAKAIKLLNPNIIIIMGGPHVTIVPEKCFQGYTDYAILGEGEETFPQLIEYIEANKAKDSFFEINGIAFMYDSKFTKTSPRQLIKNLDELPFPARHLLPMDKYFEEQKKAHYSRGSTKKTATIITSRGCPFGCIFCSIDLTMGKPFRPRNPKNVVDEIEHLIKEYGIESIEIEDDNFTFNKQRANEICDEIIKRGLKFEWRTPNGVRADRLDADLIKKFKQIGCYELWFSPESGSQRVINKVIGKYLPLEKVEFAVEECLKVGITPNCFFVIGMPGETKEEIRQTLNFMKKLKNKGAGCYINIATPLYGTRFYHVAQEKGYLRKIEDEDLIYNHGLYIDTPEFKAEEVYDFFLEGRKIQDTKKINKQLLMQIIHNPKKVIRFALRKAKILFKIKTAV